MFDYSPQIAAFRDKKVRLSSVFTEKLLKHRKSNRDRLITRLSRHIPRADIGEANFKPQGSVAMGTVIQTKFSNEEYDIDDGLVIARSQLRKDGGGEMSSHEVRVAVRDALVDKRFSRQPKIFTNCVRVFYADEDEEKHHVDFPVYRKWVDDKNRTIRELASVDDWVESDPTQVNVWFSDIVVGRNEQESGWGTQFRHLVQLLKRFCRSRDDWRDLLPNGMKLTMLVDECQPPYNKRLDVAFRKLVGSLIQRLKKNKAIYNRAHPSKPLLTRTTEDENVVALQEKLEEALSQLAQLDQAENQNRAAARRIWDWVFKSDGFFEDYDEAEQRAQGATATAWSQFDVPWCQKPVWPVILKYSVSLSGRYGNSEHGTTWNSFVSDGPALPKHLYLRFYGETDVPKPYRVFWQVVNTGTQAINAGSVRGEITEATSAGAGGLQSTSAPSPARRERTLYSGMHWVECFIVKDGVCVARSGPFVVNIQ